MDMNGVPVPGMNWDSSNLPEAWKKFCEHCELIFDGPIRDKEETVHVTYLMLWMGEKGRDIVSTLDISSSNRKKIKPICEAVKKHLQPTINPVFARYRFNNETQGEQTFEQFLTKLRLLANDCGYAEKDDMIRDRIVFGISSPKIREKLINEGERLKLNKAIQICQSFEYAQDQMREMQSSPDQMREVQSSPSSVSSVQDKPRRSGHNTSGQPGHNTSGPGGRIQPHQHRVQRAYGKHKCQNCGRQHGKDQFCPAKGKQCYKCSKWNHS